MKTIFFTKLTQDAHADKETQNNAGESCKSLKYLIQKIFKQKFNILFGTVIHPILSQSYLVFECQNSDFITQFSLQGIYRTKLGLPIEITNVKKFQLLNSIYLITRWGYPCLAWVDQPALPPPFPVSQSAFKFKRFGVQFQVQSFCCSFFFSVADFLSRTKSFIDIED